MPEVSRLSITDRAVLLGIVGQAFGVIATIGRVELTKPGEREEARRVDYASLAGGVLASSIIGTIAMALEPKEERR